MRSELEDSVRLLLFLDLSHEVDCINGNLLIEYDLSSRVWRAITKWKLLHKRNGDAQFYFQRSTVIFSFMGPQSHNEPYVRSGVFSLSYRKSHCTFYTNHNFDHIPYHIECTYQPHVYVLSMYVLAHNVRACYLISSKLYSYLLLSTLLRIS